LKEEKNMNKKKVCVNVAMAELRGCVSAGRRGWTGGSDIGMATEPVSVEGELCVAATLGQRRRGHATKLGRVQQGNGDDGVERFYLVSIGYNDNRTEAELGCFRELWSSIVGMMVDVCCIFCLHVLTIFFSKLHHIQHIYIRRQKKLR
jgi:hypothetical protein